MIFTNDACLFLFKGNCCKVFAYGDCDSYDRRHFVILQRLKAMVYCLIVQFSLCWKKTIEIRDVQQRTKDFLYPNQTSWSVSLWWVILLDFYCLYCEKNIRMRSRIKSIKGGILSSWWNSLALVSNGCSSLSLEQQWFWIWSFWTENWFRTVFILVCMRCWSIISFSSSVESDSAVCSSVLLSSACVNWIVGASAGVNAMDGRNFFRYQVL